MRVLICGTGRITTDLIQRLGDGWDITIIEKDEGNLNRIVALYPYITNIYQGDASSPVVLGEAGLADCDYVLALTNHDPSNLAAVSHAVESGVNHILARVNDQVNLHKFESLGVKTVAVNTLAAKTIYHYLEDPRLRCTPLTHGSMEVLEFEVAPSMWIAGRTRSSLEEGSCRLAAIIRNGELLFPHRKTIIQTGDRVIIVAQPHCFRSISEMFDTGRLFFPLSYGKELILALLPQKDADPYRLLHEGFHLVQNTPLRKMTVFCSDSEDKVEAAMEEVVHGIDAHLEIVRENVLEHVYEACQQRNIGLVVIPPLESSFLSLKSKLVTLAHSLPCPLLVARNSQPYEKILVPFHATPRAELALETAIDLSRQQGSEVAVVIVQEPEFVQGEQNSKWVENNLSRVREISHQHKVKIREEVRRGNPFKEIADLAKDFDLLVIGSTTQAAGLFSPHVGELLSTKTKSSVLIITA